MVGEKVETIAYWQIPHWERPVECPRPYSWRLWNALQQQYNNNDRGREIDAEVYWSGVSRDGKSHDAALDLGQIWLYALLLRMSVVCKISSLHRIDFRGLSTVAVYFWAHKSTRFNKKHFLWKRLTSVNEWNRVDLTSHRSNIIWPFWISIHHEDYNCTTKPWQRWYPYSIASSP